MSPDQVDLTEKGAAIEFEQAAIDEEKSFRDADEDFRFAASVISLGLHLKRSQYRVMYHLAVSKNSRVLLLVKTKVATEQSF